MHDEKDQGEPVSDPKYWPAGCWPNMSDGLAYLQPRAWMILDVDSRPVHEDFFETSEHAEKYVADLLDELAGVMMLEKLTSQLRLVTDEGEGEEALKAEARRMAEKVCASLNIVHAYL